MDEYLTYEEVSGQYGIPIKNLKNYVKVGEELADYPVGRYRKKKLSKNELENWNINRNERIIELNRDDYMKCLDFSLRSFYAYSSTSDFGTATQRDAGKFVSNFVSGKLGEMAVQKFLRQKFSVEINLDFDIRDAVVGQDITEIAKTGKGRKVFNPPKLRVSIKTTKMKNVWLVVSANELDDFVRSSDIYILTRVDLPLDHFFRLLKEHTALSQLGDIIPDFTTIGSEVVGFAAKDFLSSNNPVTQLPNPKQNISSSYVIRSGSLIKSHTEWKNLITNLL